jgi:hypothetical protein
VFFKKTLLHRAHVSKALCTWWRFGALPYRHESDHLASVPHAEIYGGVFKRRNNMPLIAWLLGVPLSLVLILMLMGVF